MRRGGTKGERVVEKFYQLAVSVQRKNLGGVAVEGSYLPLNEGGIVTE